MVVHPQSPLQARLNAHNVAVAPLVKAADVTTPITGTLNANVDVHGSEENPIGRGNVTLSNANVSGQPIQSVNVDFQGTGDVVNSNLLVRTATGNAIGKLTYYPGMKATKPLFKPPAFSSPSFRPSTSAIWASPALSTSQPTDAAP